MKRQPRRPTIDQVIAELEKLTQKDRELAAGSRFSLSHSMRLWCDGAAHALAWATGRQGIGLAKHLDSPPTVALELLAIALRPRKPRNARTDSETRR